MVTTIIIRIIIIGIIIIARIIIIIFIIIITGIITSGFPLSVLEDQLRQAYLDWSDASNHQDIKALTSLYTDHAIVITPCRPLLIGRAGKEGRGSTGEGG